MSGILWIVVSLTVPETYTPLLLERRAQRLTKVTGHYHVSKLNPGKKKSLWMILKVALTRPWALLFREPIVLLLSVYMAVLYGTVSYSHLHIYLFITFTIAFPLLRSVPNRLQRVSRLGRNPNRLSLPGHWCRSLPRYHLQLPRPRQIRKVTREQR